MSKQNIVTIRSRTLGEFMNYEVLCKIINMHDDELFSLIDKYNKLNIRLYGNFDLKITLYSCIICHHIYKNLIKNISVIRIIMNYIHLDLINYYDLFSQI